MIKILPNNLDKVDNIPRLMQALAGSWGSDGLSYLLGKVRITFVYDTYEVTTKDKPMVFLMCYDDGTSEIRYQDKETTLTYKLIKMAVGIAEV